MEEVEINSAELLQVADPSGENFDLPYQATSVSNSPNPSGLGPLTKGPNL